MLRRHIEGPLLRALADSPVVLLDGARQTGKTTLVRDVLPARRPARYLTLDDSTVLSAARLDPAGFVDALEGPVVLDEVQHAPELFRALKLAVDRDRRPGRFLLTGSANVLVLPRLSESLAGRMELLTLWPLSQGELQGTREGFVDALFGAHLPALAASAAGKEDLLARAVAGGYPEVVLRRSADRRRAWFDSYVATILQRDVRDISNVEGLTLLPRLLSLLAARSGSLLNFAELSRSAGIPQTTLKRYLALLEATFLVVTIPAFSTNLSKRVTRAPRIAVADPGLLASLAGLSAGRLREDPVLAGSLLESFAAMELRKQLAWSTTAARLHHFRTATGLEVDLVLEDAAGRVVGIEVRAASSVGAADLRGLAALRALCGKRFHRGVVLYTGREAVPLGRELHALPVDALWRLGAAPQG